MRLLDEVRCNCRSIAQGARLVSIDLDAASEPPAVDPARAGVGRTRPSAPARRDQLRLGLVPHAAQATRPVGLPHDRRPRSRSTDRGPTPTCGALDAGAVAAALGQEPTHPLMRLYAQALRDLGRFLGDRVGARPGRAGGRLGGAAGDAAGRGMRFFDDRGFYKRAQIVAERPGARRVGGVRRPRPAHDLRRQPRPHVLRVDGVLRYDPELAARIDAGELLPRAARARDPRLRRARLRAARGSAPACRRAMLDVRLWNRGQAPEYKAIPRHRTRCVYY